MFLPEGIPDDGYSTKERGALRDTITKLNCRSVLEVGSFNGRTLFAMAQSLPAHSLVVSIDIDPKKKLMRVLNTLRQRYTVILISGDSAQDSIIEAVQEHSPYDFIHIDGDHSPQGVKADWENYGPLATKAVGFHDIRNAEYGVKGFWNNLKTKHRHVEYCYEKKEHMGLGVIFR